MVNSAMFSAAEESQETKKETDFQSALISSRGDVRASIADPERRRVFCDSVLMIFPADHFINLPGKI